ncbi:hypothetical protein BHE74_00059451, partial [Ensete ventricosum]
LSGPVRVGMRRLEEKNTAKMGHTLLTDYYPTKLGEAVVPPAAAIPPLPPRNESSKTSNRWPVAFSTRSTANCSHAPVAVPDFRHCQANSCIWTTSMHGRLPRPCSSPRTAPPA